jgi:hypothetical protein
MPSFLLVHYCIRIGAALIGIVVIAWIRINDSRRECRRLRNQGDCPEEV